MTDALLGYGREALKAHGILTSGDAARLGIGAMSDLRWDDFFTTMARQGLYPRDLDVSRAYTLRFVNHGVGLKP
jgi:NitT/TauT family transport system substrate-binding protein